MKSPLEEVLKDETEWFREETSFLNKFLPFLSQKLFLRLIFILFSMALLLRFPAIFSTILFSFATSYIKFKRQMMRIPVEIEPSYFFAVILALAFGFKYSLFFIMIPALISALMSGMISGGLIINMVSKIFVVLLIMFLPQFNPVIIGMTGVILTDLIGLPFRVRLRQPPYEIIITLATNALLRYIYFSFFLEIAVAFLV